MSVIDIGVTVGGFVAIVFLAWFFFGPKRRPGKLRSRGTFKKYGLLSKEATRPM